MKTDETKKRSETPNVQVIRQADFFNPDLLGTLIFDREVDRWKGSYSSASCQPPKRDQLEKSWERLILRVVPRKREETLSHILSGISQQIRNLESEINKNKLKESLNRSGSPYCEQVYAAIDKGEIPPGAVVPSPEPDSPDRWKIVLREHARRIGLDEETFVLNSPREFLVDPGRWYLPKIAAEPSEQIKIEEVRKLRHERVDIENTRAGLIEERDFFLAKAEVEQIALRTRSKSAGRNYDPKAEKRREKMFEFLRKRKIKTKEKAANMMRHRHTSFRHQLYDYFEKHGVELISSDNYRRISGWLDLKKDAYDYLDEQATDYLVRDMQRHWDRFWDK